MGSRTVKAVKNDTARGDGSTFIPQKPDDTIEIDLDLDELDATSAELKAAYQEIKDYVLKELVYI